MSDIVLGALIGVGAAALGAIITGIINYKNSRLQISAAREQLGQQLDHHEREAQRNRLIESRKGFLLDLRHKLSEQVDCSGSQLAMIVRFDKAYKENPNSRRTQQETEKFFEVSNRWQQLSSQVAILCGQVSDSKLYELIESVRQTQYMVETQRLPLIRFFNNPGNANANTIEAALQKDEALRKEINNQLLQVNKRIEELLSGEPFS